MLRVAGVAVLVTAALALVASLVCALVYLWALAQFAVFILEIMSRAA